MSVLIQMYIVKGSVVEWIHSLKLKSHSFLGICLYHSLFILMWINHYYICPSILHTSFIANRRMFKGLKKDVEGNRRDLTWGTKHNMFLRKLKKTTRIKYQDILDQFQTGNDPQGIRSVKGWDKLLNKEKHLVVPELLNDASSPA